MLAVFKVCNIYRLTILLASIYLRNVNANGFLEFNALSFVNDGIQRNGQHCNIEINGTRWCNTVFVFCADDVINTNMYDVENCHYERFQTDVYITTNSIRSFGTSFKGGISNPVKIPFIGEWKKLIHLKIHAFHNFFGLHSSIENFHVKLQFNNPGIIGVQDAYVFSGVMQGLNRRTVEFKYTAQVWCDMYYFRSDCNTYCRPSNDDTNGHYACDTSTGNKICLPGWIEPQKNCTVQINKCQTNKPCLNGAECVNIPNGFECICQYGYYGERCQSRNETLFTTERPSTQVTLTSTNAPATLTPFPTTDLYCSAIYSCHHSQSQGPIFSAASVSQMQGLISENKDLRRKLNSIENMIREVIRRVARLELQ